MGYIHNIPTSQDPDLDIDEANDAMKAFVGNTTHHTEPFVDFFYPITNFGVEGETTVAGVVSATIYWRDLLENSNPEKVDGMHVVIENTCNQTFTYTWSKSELVYLGEGDLHEDVLGSGGLSIPLPESGIYSERHSSADDCKYTIHAYPSSAMLDFFKRSEPK